MTATKDVSILRCGCLVVDRVEALPHCFRLIHTRTPCQACTASGKAHVFTLDLAAPVPPPPAPGLLDRAIDAAWWLLVGGVLGLACGLAAAGGGS